MARTKLYQSLRNGLIVGMQVAAVPDSTCVKPACPLASNAEELEFSVGELPPLVLGEAFSYTPTRTGGEAPFEYALAEGSDPLPEGLTLNTSTGQITGTTEDDTAANIELTVTDELGNQQSIEFTLEAVELLTIEAPDPLPADAQEGVAYSYEPVIAGGTAPYAVALATGSDPLPAGLSLNALTGEISGTPDVGTVGAIEVTLEVSDESGQSAQLPVTFTIDPA